MQKLRKMNDIYIEAQLVIRGLELLSKADKKKEKDSADAKFTLDVPSTKETRVSIITRKPEAVAQIIGDRIAYKEFVQSLVFAIALTEDYFIELLTLVMEAIPEKLLISVKGKDLAETQSMQIDIRELLKAETLQAVLIEKSAQRARDALYASPKQYADYLKAILDFQIPADILNRYVEIKATRDLHVHGSGLINDIYLKKAGPLSRGIAPTGC